MINRRMGTRRPGRGSAARVDRTEQEFQALFTSGSFWFDADSTSDSGGLLNHFVDRVDPTHTLGQGTTANKVSSSLPNALFNSQKVVQFVSASSTHYTSSRPPGQWTHLHDGMGCDTFIVYALTDMVQQCLYGTYNAGAVPGILQIVPSAALTTHRVIVAGVTGSTVATIDVSGVHAVNVPTYVEWNLATASTPDWQGFARSVLSTSGDVVTPPSGSAPPTTFNLGRRSNGSLHSSMLFREVFGFNRVLSTAERQVVQRRMRKKYGL